jgi:hypothetical protein
MYNRDHLQEAASQENILLREKNDVIEYLNVIYVIIL